MLRLESRLCSLSLGDNMCFAHQKQVQVALVCLLFLVQQVLATPIPAPMDGRYSAKAETPRPSRRQGRRSRPASDYHTAETPNLRNFQVRQDAAGGSQVQGRFVGDTSGSNPFPYNPNMNMYYWNEQNHQNFPSASSNPSFGIPEGMNHGQDFSPFLPETVVQPSHDQGLPGYLPDIQPPFASSDPIYASSSRYYPDQSSYYGNAPPSANFDPNYYWANQQIPQSDPTFSSSDGSISYQQQNNVQNTPLTDNVAHEPVGHGTDHHAGRSSRRFLKNMSKKQSLKIISIVSKVTCFPKAEIVERLDEKMTPVISSSLLSNVNENITEAIDSVFPEFRRLPVYSWRMLLEEVPQEELVSHLSHYSRQDADMIRTFLATNNISGEEAYALWRSNKSQLYQDFVEKYGLRKGSIMIPANATPAIDPNLFELKPWMIGIKDYVRPRVVETVKNILNVDHDQALAILNRAPLNRQGPQLGSEILRRANEEGTSSTIRYILSVSRVDCIGNPLA
jgi:hypothetical protein